MRFSNKFDYALRAVLELAINYGSEVVSIHDIAEKEGIPKRYLEHLLLGLKQGGIVDSVRGKAGGYALAKRPEDITALDIMNAVEGTVNIIPKTNRNLGKSVINDVWQSLQVAVTEVLSSITLDDLVNKRRKAEKTLTYSI